MDGIRDGKIRALWVIATNGSHSWIHQNKFNDLLAKLDFLAVQDMYPSTETAQRAHLFLPAAGWGEKEGTMINSERRLGLMKKVRPRAGAGAWPTSIFSSWWPSTVAAENVPSVAHPRRGIPDSQGTFARPALRRDRHSRLPDDR